MTAALDIVQSLVRNIGSSLSSQSDHDPFVSMFTAKSSSGHCIGPKKKKKINPEFTTNYLHSPDPNFFFKDDGS